MADSKENTVRSRRQFEALSSKYLEVVGLRSRLEESSIIEPLC
jgi:hypothetical protein